METNRLRQFQTVSELMNLRKAAEVLNISHSALSKSLKVLQEQLGMSLLIQRGRNIELTEEGVQILPKIADLLNAEDRLASKQVNTDKVVKVASFEVFSTHLIGHCWGKYFPDTQLELRELLPGKLEAAIVEGVSDIGITYEPIPIKGIELILMGTIEMGIYGLKGKFSSMDFFELPFVTPISPVSGTPTGVKGLDGWPDNEMPRFCKYRVDMMESGLALARAGEAVIYAPHFVIHHHNKNLSNSSTLVRIPGPKKLKKISRNVYLIIRKNAHESKELKKVATLIRNECIRF